MNAPGRTAYLEAMGITVWQERNVSQAVPAAANEEPRQLMVSLFSRSDSPWLWVLAEKSHTENRLFADIRRAVGDGGECNLCIADEAGGINLAKIVEELLVTRVVFFGQEPDPDDLVRQKSCDIVLAPSLESLGGSADMKRALWNELQQLLDLQQL